MVLAFLKKRLGVKEEGETGEEEGQGIELTEIEEEKVAVNESSSSSSDTESESGEEKSRPLLNVTRPFSKSLLSNQEDRESNLKESKRTSVLFTDIIHSNKEDKRLKKMVEVRYQKRIDGFMMMILTFFCQVILCTLIFYQLFEYPCN
jgi:hypothetical protein